MAAYAAKSYAVRAFRVEDDRDTELPPGWTPFACTGYTIYAYK